MKAGPVSKKPASSLDAYASAAGFDFKQEYIKMWYKNGNGFGVREKYLAKQQVFRVGRKDCDKADLEAIAKTKQKQLHPYIIEKGIPMLGRFLLKKISQAITDNALSKLKMGHSVEYVKEWAKAKVLALKPADAR